MRSGFGWVVWVVDCMVRWVFLWVSECWIQIIGRALLNFERRKATRIHNVAHTRGVGRKDQSKKRGEREKEEVRDKWWRDTTSGQFAIKRPATAAVAATMAGANKEKETRIIIQKKKELRERRRSVSLFLSCSQSCSHDDWVSPWFTRQQQQQRDRSDTVALYFIFCFKKKGRSGAESIICTRVRFPFWTLAH